MKKIIVPALVAGLAAVYFLRPDLLPIGRDTGSVKEHKLRDISSEETSTTISNNETTHLGTLTISGLDAYMEVYIDGRAITYSGVGIKIPAGKDVAVEIKKDGYVSYTATVVVNKERQNAHIDVPELQTARFGVLSISNGFREGTKISFTLNSKLIEKEVPIENIELPIGHYDIIVKDPLLGSEKMMKVNIEENKKFILSPGQTEEQ